MAKVPVRKVVSKITPPNKRVSATPATGTDKGVLIPFVDRRSFLETVDQLRAAGNTWGAIRKLSKIDGVFSAAVHNIVQVAMSGYMSCARTLDGRFSPEGTIGLYSLLAQINTIYDHSKGYSRRRPINSILTTMLREVVITGGVGGELVLDKARFPDYIHPISPSGIEWISRGDGTVFPRQQPASGDPIDLDIPTVWFESSHQDTLELYFTSMMEGGLSEAFYFDEYVNDIRRSVKQSGATRLTIVISAEKIAATAPPEAQADGDKMQKYMEDTRTGIESVVAGLNPEDALVMYDTAKADHLQSGLGVKTDYVPLLKTINGLLSTALKTPPSILGLRAEGSQSLSNTETLVFLKTARSPQIPVEGVMGRALTLAMRLFGFEGYVEFKFNPIDIRPSNELEAFFTMRQNRILQKLSLGHISDDEAAWMLGCFPRVEGAPELTGTMFMQQNQVGNPTPNSDAMGRNTQSDQPTSGGGSDNEERP